MISKQSDISKLIQNCTNSEKKIDVVLLCETWVTNTTKNLIRIPGYNYVGLERSEKKGGGVGTLISKELRYKIRNDFNKMMDCMECFTIEVTIKG